MTDYSKMSDQHINQLVGIAISRDSTSIIGSDGNALIHKYDFGVFEGLCLGWKVFDPCNNPADAWPIIAENKINIDFRDSLKAGPMARLCRDNAIYAVNDNPLRAAMIVFLMMKEAGNV